MRVIDMENGMFTFDVERISDDADITLLLDKVFGPDRHEKASYALRDGVDPVWSLCLVARGQSGLAASIRFWPTIVRDLITGTVSEALFLGPLAVDPDIQGSGVGSSLAFRAIHSAEAQGHQRILLVGDPDYYSRFGFAPVLPSFITLPGGKDARRLMVRQSASLASLPAVGTLLPWSAQAVAKPAPANTAQMAVAV